MVYPLVSSTCAYNSCRISLSSKLNEPTLTVGFGPPATGAADGLATAAGLAAGLALAAGAGLVAAAGLAAGLAAGGLVGLSRAGIARGHVPPLRSYPPPPQSSLTHTA